MGIIKAVNLIFDYIRHDEEEDKDEVSHALKGVSLDIKEGDFVAILGHNLSLIHISEPTRRTPISYAVFCLKKKNMITAKCNLWRYNNPITP